MIEKNVEENEVEVLVGEDRKGRQAGITADSRWILKLLSNIYSDPYGSVIRELVSNGFDANVEADSDNNIVEISFPYDSVYNQYMLIRDYGVGMSPEFMNTKFMNYGESTKRETNNAIGLFGIGSKSPFAIRDNYEIISYIDGKAYHYMMYKDEHDIPSYDLEDVKDTDEDNGTVVKIMLNTDRYKFVEAIKKQLLYFSDVYVHDESIDNEYTIYNFNHYVVRKRLDNYDEKADICYKRVRYRIDYGKLELSTLDIPIGIKFDIGELMPTPSREDITYGDEDIVLVKERIKLSLIEICEYYNNNINHIYENYREYVQNYNIDKLIRLGEVYIDVTKARNYLKKNFDVKIELKEPQFKLLLDLGFSSGFVNPLNIKSFVTTLVSQSFTIYSFIKNGREHKKELNEGKDNIVSCFVKEILRSPERHHISVYVLGKNDKSNTKTNKFIDNAVLIKPKKKNYHEIYYNFKFLLKNLGDRTNFHDARGSKFYNHYRNHFKSYLKLYKHIQIPKDFEEQLEIEKLSRAKIILHRPCMTENVTDWKFRYDTLDEFKEKFRGIDKTIVYTHDPNVARSLSRLQCVNAYYRYGDSKKKRLEFVYCSKTNYDLLYKLKLKNFMPETEFYQGKVFGRFCTAFYLEEEIKDCNISKINPDILQKVNKDVYQKIKDIIAFIDKYSNVISSWSSKVKNEEIEIFKLESVKYAESFGLIDKSIVEDFRFVNNYLEDLKILNYIDNDKFKTLDDYEIIVDIFKLKKKRVNDEWYRFLCRQYELELLDESNDKIKYLKSINKLKVA